MPNKKIVLVTGSSSGIGLATCGIFAKNGWRVLGVSLDSPKKVKWISKQYHLDLSSPSDILSLIENIQREEGRLDAIVNNAALQVCKPITQTTIAQWDQVFAVNVRAPFLLAQQLFPLLKKSRGAIVNVSSIHAKATSSNIAAYAASKGALSVLTKNMAIEFGAAKVRANAVLPGAVDTSMLRSGLMRGHLKGRSMAQLLKQLGKKHILKRVGLPLEIAATIYFLADESQSSFITGQSFVVDGGALAKLSTE